MLLFLASIIEQLDLALEHLQKDDVHNARFGLMLTDNALELVLHRYAKDKAQEVKPTAWRSEPYAHQHALDKALGRNFRDKVSFARVTGLISNRVAQTLAVMHGFRNEVYHVGLQHEAILPALARFYFEVACQVISTYRPGYFSWGSAQVLPERARKYFASDSFFLGRSEDFSKGCASMAKACGHVAVETIDTLANHLDAVIEEQDSCIDIVAQGVYVGQQTTRDDAVVSCQTWPLAFSEKGKEFARSRGFIGSLGELTNWLSGNYPLEFKVDPVLQWQQAAQKLRAENDAHAALHRYNSFMTKTAGLRESIMEAAAICEAEIDAAIDRARED